MQYLKYPLLLIGVFVIGVLIMGGNNAYEYREESLISVPADTLWRYLSHPLYWKEWKTDIESVTPTGPKQYAIVSAAHPTEKSVLEVVASNRDSMELVFECANEEITQRIRWRIKPYASRCSLFVLEETVGNTFLTNARYAFEVEEEEERAISSYENLRVIMNARGQ